jgi:uncharacterized protein DUF6879
MSRWIYPKDMSEWAAFFTGYTTSAYRLECPQVYSSPDEDAALARFLAGEPHGGDLSWAISKLRNQIAAGRTQTLVRVVLEPSTDYTRFELAVYPEFAAAGQDTRIIASSWDGWPPGLPRHDYWMFDEHDVWRMHYHDDYTFRGAELLEGDAVIEQHPVWRDLALAQATPLDDYLAARQAEYDAG